MVIKTDKLPQKYPSSHQKSYLLVMVYRNLNGVLCCL